MDNREGPFKDTRPSFWEAVNVTLFGKEVFANVVKSLETGRLSWIICMAPKHNYERSCKRDRQF